MRIDNQNMFNINRVAEFFGFDWRMPLWDMIYKILE